MDRNSPTGYRNPALAQFIQRPAFAGTVPLRPGTLGRSAQRTPGQKNLNLNILKTVKVNEQLRLVFGTPRVSPFAPHVHGGARMIRYQLKLIF